MEKCCLSPLVLMVTLFSTVVTCQCPDGTFKPSNYEERGCVECTKIVDEKIEILISPCNKTQDSVIHCIQDYYRRLPRNWQQQERCEKCSNCGHMSLYEILPCRTYEDTHCCMEESYDVVPNRDGVPVCVERPWLCRRGQYFDTGNFLCVDCPGDTCMPLDYHSMTECNKCHNSSEENLPKHAIIIQSCNKTHQAVVGCKAEFYLNRTMGRYHKDIGCSPCKTCSSDDGMYEGRECGRAHDTVCCPQPNMTVVDTPGGPKCQITVANDEKDVPRADADDIGLLSGTILATFVVGFLLGGVLCYFCFDRITRCSRNWQYKQQDVNTLDRPDIVTTDNGYQRTEIRSCSDCPVTRERRCKNRSAHRLYVTVSDFNKDHLPGCWQFLVDYIKVVAELTVRLSVRYISRDRPQGYPLYAQRGTEGLTAFGSGTVWRVSWKVTGKDDLRCPCKNCQNCLTTARREWGQVEVFTAKHVVFDDEESRQTTCDVDYDTDEHGDTCPKLEVVGIRYGSVDQDYCILRCITHDKNLSNRLEGKIQEWRSLMQNPRKNERKGAGSQEDHDKEMGTEDEHEAADEVVEPMAVMISHPHGLSKRISVGNLIRREEFPPFKFVYTTQACEGSGGAPVCILGESEAAFDPVAIHNGLTQKHGENQSGGCVLYK